MKLAAMSIFVGALLFGGLAAAPSSSGLSNGPIADYVAISEAEATEPPGPCAFWEAGRTKVRKIAEPDAYAVYTCKWQWSFASYRWVFQGRIF